MIGRETLGVHPVTPNLSRFDGVLGHRFADLDQPNSHGVVDDPLAAGLNQLPQRRPADIGHAYILRVSATRTGGSPPELM